jgi:NADPH:quinone reductase-like Zn-dependent oxidoreductase
MPSAISFASYGPPDVLEVVDVPDLEAGPGQVRVAVRAAGVNPIDWKVRSGAMAGGRPLADPTTPGAEFSGVIDQLGAGVTGFAVGDGVLGRAAATYAEQVVAAVSDISAKPGSLSFEEAATLPVAVSAAFRILVALGLEPGQTLLADGAAGGVGAVLVQVARARGLQVIGTASERHHEVLRSLGAVPILYGPGLAERVAHVAPQGVDGAADLAGKGSLETLLQLVGDPAKVISIVDSAGAARLGVRFSGGSEAVPVEGALPDALRLIAEGKLVVRVGTVYPLADAADAHREGESGRSDGRIVLRVG